MHTEESCERKGLPTDPCLELQVTLSQLQLQQNKNISPMREAMQAAFDHSDSRIGIRRIVFNWHEEDPNSIDVPPKILDILLTPRPWWQVVKETLP